MKKISLIGGPISNRPVENSGPNKFSDTPRGVLERTCLADARHPKAFLCGSFSLPEENLEIGSLRAIFHVCIALLCVYAARAEGPFPPLPSSLLLFTG